jgi:universal stress protein A
MKISQCHPAPNGWPFAAYRQTLSPGDVSLEVMDGTPIAFRISEGSNMIAIKRILVPHDFSETSEAAVRHAVALARNFGAQLYVLHVGEKAQSDFETEFPLGLDGAVCDATRERLHRILTPAEQAELMPQFALRPGAPAHQIVQFAQDEDIDMIVMGTHGRGVIGHVVLGSVAERVVRTAPCPVLTVRALRGFAVQERVEDPARASA